MYFFTCARFGLEMDLFNWFVDLLCSWIIELDSVSSTSISTLFVFRMMYGSCGGSGLLFSLSCLKKNFIINFTFLRNFYIFSTFLTFLFLMIEMLIQANRVLDISLSKNSKKSQDKPLTIFKQSFLWNQNSYLFWSIQMLFFPIRIGGNIKIWNWFQGVWLEIVV